MISDQMSKSEEILTFLKNRKLPVQVHDHPPVFTVAEAQALRGSIPGAHTKNLFLKDRKGGVYLVSTLEEATIHLNKLHSRIGAKGRLSFGSPPLLRSVLGVEPGAVSPLGLINDVEKRCTLILDRALYGFEVINFHPLDNSLTVSISPASLDGFLAATGHKSLVLDFPSR